MTNFDVRYRVAPWNGTFGSWITGLAATTTTVGTLAATPGNTYCFVVIAHASDGGTSAATAETCTVVPLDDRSLIRAGTWSLGTGTAYFKSTFFAVFDVGSQGLAQDRRRREADSDTISDDLLDVRFGPRLLGHDPPQDDQPPFDDDRKSKGDRSDHVLECPNRDAFTAGLRQRAQRRHQQHRHHTELAAVEAAACRRTAVRAGTPPGTSARERTTSSP